MSFGDGLKRERELRGISLQEISNATKISVRLLQAIESDHFDVLPEGVFRKSFIKSYAKYLGMNEEQILHEYDVEIQPATPSQGITERPSISFKDSSSGSRRTRLLVFGVVLLVAVAGYRFWSSTRSARPSDTGRVAQSPSATPTHPSPPAGVSVVSTPPPATTGETGTTPQPPASTRDAAGQVRPSSDTALKVLGELAKKPEPVPPAGAEGSTPLELMMEANSPVWVSVSAGESTLFSGLMNPADSKKFSLEAPLKVVLGNAGGIRLQVNGQVFSSLGKTGERKTLEISAANYQQYLTPKTP